MRAPDGSPACPALCRMTLRCFVCLGEWGRRADVPVGTEALDPRGSDRLCSGLRRSCRRHGDLPWGACVAGTRSPQTGILEQQ